jgi:hypothetical protein
MNNKRRSYPIKTLNNSHLLIGKEQKRKKKLRSIFFCKASVKTLVNNKILPSLLTSGLMVIQLKLDPKRLDSQH